MKLTRFLHPNRIALEVACRDKWELLHLLVQRLRTDDASGPSVDVMLDCVFGRERQLSTGLERGIALPHGLLPASATTRGVLGVVPRGVEFGSLDGHPARIVMLMVFPDTPEGKSTHLSLLSSAIRLFTDEETRGRILGAVEPHFVLSALEEAEIRLGV